LTQTLIISEKKTATISKWLHFLWPHSFYNFWGSNFRIWSKRSWKGWSLDLLTSPSSRNSTRTSFPSRLECDCPCRHLVQDFWPL